MIVQCVNINTSQEKSLTTKSLIYKSVVNSKSFKCHHDFLWRPLDNLKQWKRRRRVYLIHRTLESVSEKLREKRRAVEFDGTKPLVEVKQVDAESPPTDSTIISKFKRQWPVQLWRDYGLFSDDYLLIINSHWLSFPPPHPGAQYALGALYIVMMIVGCTGNALVLLMYFR